LDNEKVFEKYFQYVGIFDEDDEDDEDVDDIYILDSSTGSIDSLSSTSSILNHNSDADADAEASVDYSNDTSCSEYEEDSTREEITPQTSPQKSSKNLESLSYRFIPPQAITPRFHDENLPPYPITFYPILSESSGSGSENETQTSHSDSFSTTTSLESPPIPPSVETPQERTPVDSTSPIPATNEAKNNETEEKEKEKEDDKDLPPPILPLSPSLPIDISFQVEDQVEIFPTQIIVDQIGISTTFVRHHFPLFDPIGLKITQHDDRLSLTVLINQAEIMERWDDMALLTRQLVILSNGCLTVTERRAFAVAHKQCIQPRRQAIRSLRYPFVDEDMRQVMDLSLDHVEYETITFCKSLIQFITAHVLRATLSAADEYVFWLRLVADSYRYIAEINVGSDFDSCRLARSYYHDAALLAERYLHISDPIRLGLLLNYSVASFELFNDYKTACGMLKTAFSKAVLRLDDLSPAEFTDSILLLQLMRDNLLLWTTMVAAENECDVNRVEQDDEKDDEDDDENDGSDEDDEDEDDGRGGRIGENKENKENKEKVNSIEDEWLREAIRLKKIEDKLLRKKEPKKWWERNKVNKKEGVERREDRPIRKAIIFQTPFEIQMSAAHPRNYPIRLPVNNSNSYLVPKLPPKEYNDVDEEDYFGDQKGRNATFNGVSSVNGVDNFNYIDDDDDNDDDDDDDWDDYDGEGEEGGNYDPYNDDYSPSYFDEYDRHHNNQE
jgi:14-3-3 protein epsilon